VEWSGVEWSGVEIGVEGGGEGEEKVEGDGEYTLYSCLSTCVWRVEGRVQSRNE